MRGALLSSLATNLTETRVAVQTLLRQHLDEMFGRGATYELEDGERQEIEGIIDKFAKEMRELGIGFSKVAYSHEHTLWHDDFCSISI